MLLSLLLFVSHLRSALQCYFYCASVAALSVFVCYLVTAHSLIHPVWVWRRRTQVHAHRDAWMNYRNHLITRASQSPPSPRRAASATPAVIAFVFCFQIRFFLSALLLLLLLVHWRLVAANRCASECGIWDTLGRILVKPNGNSMGCWRYVDRGR